MLVDGIRELAYTVKILEVKPIPGYDRVEHVRVNGWWVICQKGQFKPGDYAVYFEIDSRLPATEPFLFLAKRHYKIKTIKMCKVLSQGLLMSFDDFCINGEQPPWLKKLLKQDNIENYPLTAILNVTYSAPEDNVRKGAPVRTTKRRIKKYNKGWPKKFNGVTKTDQDRVENLYPSDIHDDRKWVVTCKVDGTSATYILHKKLFGRYEYYVLSRNVRQKNEKQSNYHSDEENIYWEVSKKYHIKEFLKDYIKKNKVKWACIQGEIAGVSEKGAAIQGDPHKLGCLRFFGFHFTDSNKRLGVCEAQKLCNDYGIDWVPILDENYTLPATMEELKQSADGACDIKGSQGLREGFVYYWVQDPYVSFKNVSNKYLMKKSK